MELAIGIILGIVAGVAGFWIFNRKQKDELDSLRKAKTDLTAERDSTQKDKVDLENQLKGANVQIGNLESEVTEKAEQIDNLESEGAEKTARIDNLESEVAEKAEQINNLINDLQEARARIDTLKNQLKKVSKSNENALKLLHLFELSLQLTAFALCSEMSRVKHLGVENRKFNAAYKNLRKTYEDLHVEYEDIFDTYEDFREKVKKKAKRRVFQSGVGLFLSLIPGVGALQLAADLIELADFASDLSENTADFCDLLSVADLYLSSSSFLEDFVDYKSIKSLQPEISSDQGSEKVKQESQSIFKGVVAENLAQDNKEPDASDFNNFLKTMIQRVGEFVDSMPESERRNALNRLIGNFGQFGIALYTYHDSPKTRADRSLPAPKN